MAISTNSRGGEVGTSSTTTGTQCTNSNQMWNLPKQKYRRYGDGLEVRSVPVRVRIRSATPGSSSTCPHVKELPEANHRFPDAHTTQDHSSQGPVQGRGTYDFRRSTFARRTTTAAAWSATN
jgi:hypothetical protein